MEEVIKKALPLIESTLVWGDLNAKGVAATMPVEGRIWRLAGNRDLRIPAAIHSDGSDQSALKILKDGKWMPFQFAGEAPPRADWTELEYAVLKEAVAEAIRRDPGLKVPDQQEKR